MNTTTPDGYIVNELGQWVENGIVRTQKSGQTAAQSTNLGFTTEDWNYDGTWLYTYNYNINTGRQKKSDNTDMGFAIMRFTREDRNIDQVMVIASTQHNGGAIKNEQFILHSDDKVNWTQKIGAYTMKLTFKDGLIYYTVDDSPTSMVFERIQV